MQILLICLTNISFIFFSFFLMIFLMLEDKDLSYDHLALGLKAALQNDKSAFDADRLQKYTGIFFSF